MSTSTAMIIIDGLGEIEATVSKRGRENFVISEVEKFIGHKGFYVRSNRQGGMNVIDLDSGHRIGAVYWVN